jgi:hypothetical protein
MEITKKYDDKQKMNLSVTLSSNLFGERAMLERLAKVLSDGATKIEIMKDVANDEWSVVAAKRL